MPWTDARLDSLRLVGDPVADEVVSKLFADGSVQHVNDLMQTLRGDDDPASAGLPPAIRQYLATVTLPPWADLAVLRRAQDLFQLWGLQIGLSLFCASLPSDYAAANGVKVLFLTARLDTDARRRIMETGQFLMDVMGPGSFEPGGSALRTIQRVRLMHAGIRHLIRTRADEGSLVWDEAAWGKPLNQEDLAGTLMSFAYVVGLPLPKLGIKVSPPDADTYIRAWNVIGNLLGVQDELLPKDAAEAGELVQTIRRRQFAASDEGREMTAALITFLEGSLPSFGRLRIVPPMIRHLIGDDAADMIDVPREKPEAWRQSSPLRRVVGWWESQILRHRVLQRLAEPLGRELIHGVFNYERGGIRAAFAIPVDLARSWELPSLDEERRRP